MSFSRAIDNELFLYGGVDKEETFTCAEGLYVFNIGMHSVLGRGGDTFWSVILSDSVAIYCLYSCMISRDL